jgi:5-methylthioribose kinase
LELTPENASQYLNSRPETGGERIWRISALGGGVSNTVLLAEAGGRQWVLKQSLGKLRVKEDWFADRERIHRECAAMILLRPHLPEGAVPAVIFHDTDNYIYAMEAASDARDWKSLLLGGSVETEVATAAGRILAAQIRASWESAVWEEQFGDQNYFDQLRLDPYYRFTARRHPDLAAAFEACVESCGMIRQSLVHGDFSPKNLLVKGTRVTLIDFEVIHYGNPAFDAAFLLNHLLLKSVHQREFRQRYAACAMAFWKEIELGYPGDIEKMRESTMMHWGCLFLARVDGKSPAEYLSGEGRDQVRRLGREMILRPPADVREGFARVQS